MNYTDIRGVEFWEHFDGPDVWRKTEEQEESSGFKNYLLQCTIRKGDRCKNPTSFSAFFLQCSIGIAAGRPFK